TFCRLHFPEVGTIPKPRKNREFPELGLIVSQPRTLTNNHFTTGKTPTSRCWMADDLTSGVTARVIWLLSYLKPAGKNGADCNETGAASDGEFRRQS
ncbi:hypothetical protein, partial [Levilactobacillus spicheri]